MSTLDEIIERIVIEADPDKIILFGSRAKRKDKRGSDYDICILKKRIMNRRELAKRIYHKLFGIGASVDVIVETPNRFNKLKNKWFLIYNEIAKFGEVIYEK